MNKKTATDIIKKYSNENARDEALALAEKNEYTLRVQIENGEYTLMNVTDGETTVYAQDVLDSVEEPSTPVPAEAPKEVSKKD